MKSLKWIISFAVLFGAVLMMSSCAQSVSAQDDTYLTIDINPSVELIVNKREKVIYVNPLNEDAEVLLDGIDLIGMDLDEAVDLIIQTAIELGYIDTDAEETYVKVSSISENAEIGEKIRERAKEHINNAFSKRYMMGKAEDKGFTPDFLAEAESYGVTPGFLFLAKSAVEVSDELLLQDALLMTVQELQVILQDSKAEMREVAHALKDQFLSDRKALYDLYFPQLEVIQTDLALKEAELLDLEGNLADKEALLLEAIEENKPAIEAEIVSIQAEIEAAKVELDTIKVNLEALRLEFHEAVRALRDEFHEQSEALRNQIREMVQNRRSMFEAKVREFFQNHQGDNEEDKDRIRNWQKKRP